MKKVSKSILLALIIVTSSLAGCLGNDSDDSKDSDDSESSSGGCDSAPWLFVMTGHNVTIKYHSKSKPPRGRKRTNYSRIFFHTTTLTFSHWVYVPSIDTNASNMNATFTIHNEEFIGSVVALHKT